MQLKPILFIGFAIGLYYVAHSAELRGDAAPVGANGVSPERAKYHVTALVMMLGALGFFIAGGVSAFRK